MSIKENLIAVPRSVVGTSLAALRLPLTAAGRITGQAANEQWPPALAYESFEATVETVVGGVLHDEALVDRGRVRQAKLAQLRKAADLEALAQAERREAQQRLEERRDEAEQRREQGQEQAEQRKQQAAKAKQERQRKSREKAEQAERQARQVEAAREAAIERQERTAKLQALAEEEKALAAAKDAVDTEETAAVIQDTLEGTKESRHAS